ncbi:hypothetical protein FJY70_01685 [candidate division WOR-3 bacterium]|nr:hypothetical protein [candidate division WOR-3 bacterium]
MSWFSLWLRVQFRTLLAHSSHSGCDPLPGPGRRPRCHGTQQALRASDYTGFMLLGVLKEFGATRQVFANPKQRETEDYISGRFG